MDYVSPGRMITLPNHGARCQHTMGLNLFSCCISAERSALMSCPCVASRSAANTSATAACMLRPKCIGAAVPSYENLRNRNPGGGVPVVAQRALCAWWLALLCPPTHQIVFGGFLVTLRNVSASASDAFTRCARAILGTLGQVWVDVNALRTNVRCRAACGARQRLTNERAYHKPLPQRNQAQEALSAELTSAGGRVATWRRARHCRSQVVLVSCIHRHVLALLRAPSNKAAVIMSSVSFCFDVTGALMSN